MSASIVTSVRVKRGDFYDRVRVWNRGALAGELLVLKGDGPFIAQLLVGEESTVSLGEFEDTHTPGVAE